MVRHVEQPDGNMTGFFGFFLINYFRASHTEIPSELILSKQLL